MFAFTPEKSQQFNAAADQLKHQHIISLPFFLAEEIAELVAATDMLAFRSAQPVVGNQVFQDFDVCFPAPLRGCFQHCATLLEACVRSYHSANPEQGGEPYSINDFAVQRYASGSRGIGIHKDGLRYRQFVFIITLAGQSRLFSCTDRQGSDKIIIDDSPGRLVMLAAPGFAGLKRDEDRPLHGVDQITGGRLSIGFRCERKTPTSSPS